jgi:hypothetical protein
MRFWLFAIAIGVTAIGAGELAQAEARPLSFTLDASTIAAFGLLIASVGTAIATVINARTAARKAEEASARMAAKLETLSAKTEVIKTSVDGAASAQLREAAVLRKELEMMRAIVASERAAADKLAVAAATVLATPSVTAVATPSGTTAVSATDATVQDLKDKQG